jgi:hypothetical protein
VTSGSNSYSRFRRALVTKNPAIIQAAAAEVPRLPLDDALEILWLMAHKRDPRCGQMDGPAAVGDADDIA